MCSIMGTIDTKEWASHQATALARSFRAAYFRRVTAAMCRVLRRAAVRYERQRSRRELRLLSTRMLKDIGVSRMDAEREARRPFWD